MKALVIPLKSLSSPSFSLYCIWDFKMNESLQHLRKEGPFFKKKPKYLSIYSIIRIVLASISSLAKFKSYLLIEKKNERLLSRK